MIKHLIASICLSMLFTSIHGQIEGTINKVIDSAYQLYYPNSPRQAISFLKNWEGEIKEYPIIDQYNFWANIGYLYYFQGQFTKSKEHYIKALTVYRSNPGIIENASTNIFLPLANIFSRDGDFEMATYTLREAISILKKSGNLEGIVALRNMLALSLSFQDKHKEAEQIIEALLAESFNLSPEQRMEFMVVLAHSKGNQKDILGALRIVEEAESLLAEETPIRIKGSISSIKGDLYNELDRLKLAQIAYASATALYYKNIKAGNFEDWRQVAKIHLALGKIALDQQNYLSAQQAYHRALSMRLDGVDSTDWNYLPLDTLPFADNVFIEALLGKARVFHRTGQLELALQAYRMAWRSLSDLLAELDLAESKSNLVEFAYPIYAEWMALLFEMNAASADASWHAAAFELMELSKAQQLRAWLATMDELKARKLPAEQIAREADLRQEWRRLEKSFLLSLQAFEAGEIPQDSVNHWAGQLYAAKDTHTAYLARILPEGTSMATDPGLPQLTEVQANMSPDAAILEYFLGEGKAFALLIKPQQTIAYSLPLDQAFTDQVRRFREKIFQVEQGPTMELGYALYRQLIAPLAKDLADVERLTIIPDGAMQGMPFEALVQSPQTPRHPDYLIKDYVISYGFSVAAHLNPPATDLSFDGGNCLAVSLHMPTESGQACAVLFPFVDKFSAQAEGIVAQLGGLALTGEQATAQHFVAEAPHYPILHIGSHGMVETAYPNLSYLAFFGPEDRTQICPSIGALYAADILAQNLNSELVFIEACEVAYQEKLVRPGEGVLGLARAFAYAGARSIVSTLWRVSPESGPQALSTLFYTYLQQGHPKDVALALTKRDLLSGDKRFAAPFYWAGFVAIGDMQPVTHLSKMPPWIGPMLIGLFLLILGILIWNRMATAPHSS